jgi:hypothetical protein
MSHLGLLDVMLNFNLFVYSVVNCMLKPGEIDTMCWHLSNMCHTGHT